ncbi:MAG: hypothetical protein AB7E05_00065 [Sphingobium sp.]
MSDFSELNVFQMYAANNLQAGFWLRRTTWGNTCAQVTSVGEFKGPPPYYGNPAVFADIYDLRTGALKEQGATIPVPGTYKAWRQIDPPSWASQAGRADVDGN